MKESEGTAYIDHINGRWEAWHDADGRSWTLGHYLSREEAVGACRRKGFEKIVDTSTSKVAKELLFLAKEMVGIDFPTQDAYDKYMKDHPDADKTNHRVVKTPEKAPAKKDETSKGETGKSLKDFNGDSDKYHEQSVLPALKHTLSKHVPEGVKLRGSGRKVKKHLELIADIKNPWAGGGTLPVLVDIHGSYISEGDGQYEIRVHSPHVQGDHTYHAPFSGDPKKDADAISKDMGDMLDDFKGFIKEQFESEKKK